MKVVFILFLLAISEVIQAADTVICQGTVLQRRFALVQFGQNADSYVASKGELPDLCAEEGVTILDNIPALLQNAVVCGSSEKGAVYYSCQLPSDQAGDASGHSPVIETCRYSLIDQSVICENRSVVTTFETAP